MYVWPLSLIATRCVHSSLTVVYTEWKLELFLTNNHITIGIAGGPAGLAVTGPSAASTTVHYIIDNLDQLEAKSLSRLPSITWQRIEYQSSRNQSSFTTISHLSLKNMMSLVMNIINWQIFRSAPNNCLTDLLVTATPMITLSRSVPYS